MCRKYTPWNQGCIIEEFPEEVLKCTTGFGIGIWGSGNICSAVTISVIAICLKRYFVFVPAYIV